MEISVRESLEKKGKQKYNIITMIYFVTEQYLKLNVPITNNVDDTDFVPLIKSAADQYVRSILGTYFYNYLLQEYNNQTLSATEITLVQDYIQYSVAWRVASETAITVSYQLKNKGLQKQSGDYSQAVDMSEIAFMSHHYRDRADFYDQRLIKYLEQNKSLYPEFMSQLNNDTVISKLVNCTDCSGNGCYSCRTYNNFNSGIHII